MDLMELKEKDSNRGKRNRKNLLILSFLLIALGISVGVNIQYIFQGPLTFTEETQVTTTPKYSILNQGNASLSDLYKEISQSVVLIEAQKTDGNFQTGSQGSGFIYRADGYIVTNNHVVEGAKDITVTFQDGEIVEGKVIGSDPYSDLAAVKVNRTGLKPIPIGNMSQAQPGDTVLALGNPFGLEGTITKGIISQKNRLLDTESGFTIPNVIQTDAAINPGNSGGPLINLKGEVLGVNTAIRSKTGTWTGIGFAVSIQTVKRVIPSLIKKGEYKYAWMGIRGRSMNPSIAEEMNTDQEKGLLIVEAVENGPAHKAGLQGGQETALVEGIEMKIGGDIVTAINGESIMNMKDLVSYLAQNTKPGDEVTLTIIRDNEEKKIDLTLGTRPETK